MIIKAGTTLIHAMDEKLGTDIFTKLTQLSLGFHTPNYWFRKRQIAFIHLPKTAGTSLHTLLGQDDLRRFVNLNKHRPVSRFCQPGKYQYITVMRDPVERVWSYYRMVLRNPPGSPYQRYAEGGLEQFLTHCWEVRNLACRYYSGHVKREPDAQTLELARANLSKFLCVLSFARFTNDLSRFLTDLQIPHSDIGHERRAAYDPPTDEERALIVSYNALDLELFNTYETAGKNL